MSTFKENGQIPILINTHALEFIGYKSYPDCTSNNNLFSVLVLCFTETMATVL